MIELTGALKEQFPRHCFIKIQQQKTQPMLVPRVEENYTVPKNLAWYVDKLLTSAGALPAAEVDRLLKERDVALLRVSKKTPPKDFRE